jgi:hypothetical protein
VNHDQLMAITAHMPMKQIDVSGAPYLQRYFAGRSADNGQWWYHRFITADGERHIHSHPWTGTSLILCGKYVEQLRQRTGDSSKPFMDRIRYFNPGTVNLIFPSTLHRIIEIEANTWTMLHIKPGRHPTWSFFDDDERETVMQTSPEDWYTAFPARAA